MNKYIIISAIFIVPLLSETMVHSQTFLNGNFEKHTVPYGTDEINLSNASFNTKMDNAFAFGTYGDVDIISTANYSGLAQDGSWFVALTGGGTDIISMELSSPLVKGNAYTITFWDRASNGFTPQPFQIGVSEVNDAFGTPVYTAELPVSGSWTQRNCTFVAPVSGKYITVQLSGANNVGDWAHVDNFSFGAPENTVSTGGITGSPFCGCSIIDVPFTSTGSYSNGNEYSAQLSDAGGSFAHPVDIGKLRSTDHSGIIACVIPCVMRTGSSYRIRVTASKPDIAGSDNGADITINSNDQPTINITSEPGNVIREGTTVTFVTTTTNGGTRPVFQWKLNGVNAGGNDPAFASASLKNGDVVTVFLTSNASCVTSETTVSNAIIIEVTPSVVPSVVITATTGTTIHKGQPVTFKATPTHGGPLPVYEWLVNDKPAGGKGSTFTISDLEDGDIVNVVMTSNASQAFPEVVTSNAITMLVKIQEVGKSAYGQQAKSKSSHITYTFNKNLLKLQKRFFKHSAGKGNSKGRRNIRRCPMF
jgi:hypothetical protein